MMYYLLKLLPNDVVLLDDMLEEHLLVVLHLLLVSE
jgi:hypothetical protein